MSNFVEESVNQVNEMNTGVEVDRVLNGVRNRERNFSRNPRVYKHNQTGRGEMSNLYQYGNGYQNQQYNNNWGENVQFDQTRLTSYTNNYATSYPTNSNSYPTSTNNYPTNTNSNYPASTTSYPNNSSSYSSSRGNNYVHGYTGTMPLVGDARMPPMPMNNSQVLVDQVTDTATLEEMAHLFTYRYYSLLNTNPSYMYSLYSKDAQMSKPDVTGKRVVASDHNEIRNYYQQYTSYVLTSNIHSVEVQLVSSHPLFLVQIAGSYTLVNEKEGLEQTKQFVQTVLLSGDLTRSRYQVINDLVTELQAPENATATTYSHGTPTTSVAKELQGSPHQDLMSDTSRNVMRKDKDVYKLAIFGIPPMVTEVILTDLINQRLAQLESDGKVVDVAVKPQKVNRKSNESLLYAFVELDSKEAADTLLANDLIIQDRNITIEPYKRTDKKRDHKPKNLSPTY
ncbi:hypothetical protein MACK_003845 [Theileria orientalis]|uniref:NTF2 domain-containing protein n=1 Tax=Theileria orientalis TaxID=68886 RepID=A0A976SIY2_THEOR|nr:hypothetical protein MACK_003845 [Theileria orientalis]